ncbi:MAG: hypothetical protein M1457_06825 [bacterium]|nr:hypothetical protein [bacterium]
MLPSLRNPCGIRNRSWRLILPVLVLAGCAHWRGVDVSVPLKNTAAEQYRYATDYRDSKNLELVTEQKKLNLGREIIRQTFAKVYEYFPEDRIFAPLAKLDVIIIEAGLDTPRAKVSKHERLKAVGRLENLASQYPEYEYVQAMCLFEQGQIYKLLGDRRAMGLFDDVRKEFSKSKDKKIQSIVEIANRYYNEVHVYE